MSRKLFTLALAGLVALGAALVPQPALAQGKLNLGAKKVPKTPPPPREEVPAEYKDTPPVLRFKMRDIDGQEVDLKSFKGNVIVMVNTASECGYKDQLGELQEMYEKHKDQGFVVLAFPSNDFEQEPKEGQDLKTWCAEKYKVAFKLFERVGVKTPDSSCDLYKFLADKKKNSFHGGPIKWNYTKFVIDRKGEIRGRFESAEKPSGKKMTALVERLLKVKVPGMPAAKDKKDGGQSDEEGKDGNESAGGGEKKPEKPKSKSM